MSELMDDVYRRYTDNVHHVRMHKGTFEVAHEDLELLLGLFMRLCPTGNERLDRFADRVSQTLLGITFSGREAEELPEVRPARFEAID